MEVSDHLQEMNFNDEETSIQVQCFPLQSRVQYLPRESIISKSNLNSMI